MRLQFCLFASFLSALGTKTSYGFVMPGRSKINFLLHSTPNPNNLSQKDINGMAAEALEQMKNLKPEDLDEMIEEFDNMGAIQRTALKAMNMDPDMMKKTMMMMRNNPSMIRNAQQLMETMTPEELFEQSRKAQEQLSQMTPNDLEAASKAMEKIPEEQLSAAVNALKNERSKGSVIEATTVNDDDDEKSVMDMGPGSSSDKEVIDAMFRVAEFMSDPISRGGVTFAGFASLPIVQLLSGDREADLSPSELRECWADGSLGAARVDRNGFERVWKEVQEYFEDDIMGEARKEAKKTVATKKKRGDPKPTTSGPAFASTTIGESLSEEELKKVNDRVKSLSNEEVDSVLNLMEVMDPAQEARLKAMGVDPKIMQKTAQMMKENPQLREEAKKMMANMSPEDMLKASQQAQQQMAGMSGEDVSQTLDQIQNRGQAKN